MQQGFALLLVLCAILFMSAIISITYRNLYDFYYFVENNKNKQFDKQLLLASERLFLKEFNKVNTKEVHSNNILTSLSALPETIKLNNRVVHYRLVENTNCFNVKTLNSDFNRVNKDDVIYLWIVFKYILQFNDLTYQSPGSRMRDFDFSSEINFHHDYIGGIDDSLMPGAENTLAAGYLSDYLINISDVDLLKITPFLCYRNDDVLLININMLELKHSKLLQSILMDMIDEDDVTKLISSKPAGGWTSVNFFFEYMAKNTAIDSDNIDRLKNILVLKFTHDKYYFSSIFKLANNNGSYQLRSTFYVNDKGVTVVRRRFSSSE